MTAESIKQKRFETALCPLTWASEGRYILERVIYSERLIEKQEEEAGTAFSSGSPGRNAEALRPGRTEPLETDPSHVRGKPDGNEKEEP